MPEPERDLGGVRLVGAGEAINEWNLVFGEHESVDLEKQPREVDVAEVFFGDPESEDFILQTIEADAAEVIFRHLSVDQILDDSESEDLRWSEITGLTTEEVKRERLMRAEIDAKRAYQEAELAERLVKERLVEESEEIRLLIKEKHEKNARSVEGAYAFVGAVLFSGGVVTTLVLMSAVWLGEGYGIGTDAAAGLLIAGACAAVSLTLVYAFFRILRAIHAVLVQILDRLPPEPAGSAPVPIATGGSPSASASDKIFFYCPHCATDTRLQTLAKSAGKNTKCPKCHEIFVVPSVSEPKRPSGNARSL